MHKASGSSGLPLLSMSAGRGVELRDLRMGRAPSEDLSAYLVVEPGDIVVNRLSARDGAFGRSQIAGIVSPAYWVLRPAGGFDSRFVAYALRSSRSLAEIARLSKFMPPAQFEIAWQDFRELSVPAVPLDEQRRIADFLDDQVSRIAAVIGARRAQSHLEEAALVSARSTLLDDLESKYGATRLRHLVHRIEQGWSPQADSAPAGPDRWGVVRAGCVNGGRFDENDNKALPEDLEVRAEYEIRGGDLLMSRASGSLDLIGSIAVVPSDVRSHLLLCDKVYRLRLSTGWSTALVAHSLRSHRNRERIRLGVSGAAGMANNLPSGVIRDLVVPTVPVEHQDAAVASLANAEGRTAARVRLLDRSIDLLQEYKQSLVTAAVTGALDVTTASRRSVPA